MTVRAHADAVLAILSAAPGNLRVLDGAVPKDVLPPYVLLYFADADPEVADNRPLEGGSQRFVLRVYAHSVGGSSAAARALGERVRTALLDLVPVVTGRECFPIRREDGQPPQREESTGTLVMDRIDVYRLESVPA
ncbi:tail completion protein gp17 [Micromonospora humida]|uniref:tail completion protein gp17 n=1 Tax=Micromonospora humida TaxID=2809018 RepID=UPI00342E9E3A